tara:strand:- start:1739 stop:2206 length:468 start_codon:yes stop_codon:yes gene_type:complete
MIIKNGDLLHILGEGNVSWYGEKVGKDDHGRYEIYYINKNNDIYEFDKYYSIVDKESILTHVSNSGDYKQAWSVLGFEYHNENNSIWLRKKSMDEINAIQYEELNTSDSEVSSITIDSCDTWSTTESDDSDLSDFIDNNSLKEHIIENTRNHELC